jgi:predicted SnoaL-like aldol condensation-catalyzing enzyme
MMKYVVSDHVQHDPGVGDGHDAAVAMLEPLFGAPGATFSVRRIIVDRDLGAIRPHGRPHPFF